MGFYEEISKYYDIIFPLSHTTLKFIEKHLDSKKRVLDVAAGTGNYSIALSEAGYNVVAVDLDEEMINSINIRNMIEGTTVRSYMADMKNIEVINEEKFDLIFCIGNSLVHLDNREEIDQFIEKMYSMLNKNGKLIIQIVNYDRVLKYDVKELPLIDRRDKGVCFKRNYDLVNGKIQFKTKLIIDQDKRSYENCVELYPLKKKDLEEILVKNRFKEINFFGDFDGSDFSINSFPTIVVATKKR